MHEIQTDLIDEVYYVYFQGGLVAEFKTYQEAEQYIFEKEKEGV